MCARKLTDYPSLKRDTLIIPAVPWAAAYEIRNLFEEELPKLNSGGPPIIRDTIYDEQGIYFTAPMVVKEEPGRVLILTVQGSIWTWDGAKYCPNLLMKEDVLDIELLPYSQGTKLKIVPRLPPETLKVGLVEHIEGLLAALFRVPAAAEPKQLGDQKAAEVKPARGDSKAAAKRGPTTRTQTRAEVFKKLKDEHRVWSQARVAMEASDELREDVSGDTVRNTYRAMGWKWERADRIR